MTIKTLVMSSRAPFLILAPICVFLGVSTAIHSQAELQLSHLILVFVGGLTAHISVNNFNEYYDFKSGLDLITRKTPFSGGSGALEIHPENLNRVFQLAWSSLIITMAIGIYFIFEHGLGILPIGVLGILLVIAYTEWITRSPLICLLAPGLGFGYLMVAGTHYALTGEFTCLVFLVATVPFFLVNNLLLLNQYPDIEADTRVGRNHAPIVFGTKVSTTIYALFGVLAFLVVVCGVFFKLLPVLSLIALLPLPFAVYSFLGAMNYGADLAHYPKYLAANVQTVLLTPALLGVSIII